MIKILVVDDEIDFCNSLDEFLSREGYEVITATSGVKAIEIARRERPQLVLLDIRMPKMDGIQTLKRIREIDNKTEVIMVTIVKDTKIEDKALRLGATNYITKPINLDLLKRNVYNCARWIEVEEFKNIDIIVTNYDEKNVKTVLERFRQNGFKMEMIETADKGLEATKDHLDFLIIRADLLGDDIERVLDKYRQTYPRLPIMVTTKPELHENLINRIKRYSSCKYLPPFFDNNCLIMIIYKMISLSSKVIENRQEQKTNDCIIVVDDEPEICTYVSKYLTREGYDVCAIIDSRKVLERVRTLRPSLVFLDIIMPNVDGLELLKKIKKISPDTQVVMMTGIKNELICKEAIESGASDYLVKPFSLDQLKAMALTNTIKSHWIQRCIKEQV